MKSCCPHSGLWRTTSLLSMKVQNVSEKFLNFPTESSGFGSRKSALLVRIPDLSQLSQLDIRVPLMDCSALIFPVPLLPERTMNLQKTPHTPTGESLLTFLLTFYPLLLYNDPREKVNEWMQTCSVAGYPWDLICFTSPLLHIGEKLANFSLFPSMVFFPPACSCSSDESSCGSYLS